MTHARERKVRDENALADMFDLQRAQQLLAEYQNADGALNWYYRADDVREALARATSHLGEGNERLQDAKRRFNELTTARREPLAKAAAFATRADIQELDVRRERLKAEVDSLERDGAKSDEKKALLSEKRDELRDAETLFASELAKANLRP